jgi:hypothetical protein
MSQQLPNSKESFSDQANTAAETHDDKISSMLAAIKDHTATIQLLLDHSENIEAKTYDGKVAR